MNLLAYSILKHKTKIKKSIMVVMSFVLVSTSTYSVVPAQVTTTNSNVKSSNVQRSKSLKDLSYFDRIIIDSSIAQCEENGKTSAEIINKFSNDREKFEIAVRNVLNQYYCIDKTKRSELENFADNIDSSAKTILSNYKEAEIEREKKKSYRLKQKKL